MRPLVLLSLLFVLGGCTVDGGTDGRFQRTGFPGFFEPSVTIIVDTLTDRVYVIGAGSLADGAVASALRRPTQVVNTLLGGNASADASANAIAVAAAAATAQSNGNGNNGHGHGHGEDDD